MEKKTWRILLIVFLLLVVSFGSAQNAPLETAVRNLKEKIKASDGTIKLKLLDSLTQLIKYQREFQYDSIARVTIDLAVKEQDYNMAARQTGELVFFLVNKKRNSEEGLKLFKATLDKNWEITDPLSLAVLYSGGADSFLESGQEAESVHYYEAAEELFLQVEDSTQYAKIKGYKAYALSLMGEFASASQEYQKALLVFMKKEDGLNILKLRIGLSILYSQNRFYNEAEKEYLAIDALALELKDYGAYLVNLGNMAYDYAAQGKYKKSISCNKRKLAVIDLHPELDYFAPYGFQALALDYIVTDSLDKARLYIHKLKASLDRNPENHILKDLYVEAETQLFLAEGDLSKAEAKAKALLDMRQGTKDYEVIMEVHELLYGIYEAKKDEPQALKHLKVYTKIKDSIESVQKTRALSYYQTLYETEKRDAKISKKEAEIELLNHKNRAKQRWMIFGGIALIAVFAIIYLFRGKRFAQERQELQGTFSQKLIVERENERSRLAMELHDSVGQKLMLLKKRTKEVNNEVIETLAERSLDELRSISRGLHPAVLDRFGFSKAIAAMVDEIDSNSDILFTLDIENVDEHISKEAAIHLYRIVQECLNNVVKHSKARAVAIDIEKEDRYIHTTITDNGLGFVVSEAIRNSKSLGMNTLLKRAKIIKSKIHIDSVNNKGTTVNIITPIYVMNIS
ncbi:MAG: histidine kinase [Bacteroidota bacterium]